MGLFGPSYRPLERRLIESAEQRWSAMGISGSESKERAVQSVQKAIELAKASGRHLVGPLGEGMLAERSGFWFDYFRQIRHLDGVRDEDIRLWWDLDEVERQMVGIDDELAQLAVWIGGKQRGLSDADAGLGVRKTMPMYGVPEHMSSAFDGRRLLPFELKDRVMRWLERNASRVDPAHLPWDEFETYNDWVRHTVENGDL